MEIGVRARERYLRTASTNRLYQLVRAACLVQVNTNQHEVGLALMRAIGEQEGQSAQMERVTQYDYLLHRMRQHGRTYSSNQFTSTHTLVAFPLVFSEIAVDMLLHF